MTSTEVKAFAIANALSNNPSTWGKDQAATSMTTISKLVKAGKAGDIEADQARSELGNHSATRQYLEKHGLLAVADDALSKAIKERQEKMVGEADDELAKA